MVKSCPVVVDIFFIMSYYVKVVGLSVGRTKGWQV